MLNKKKKKSFSYAYPFFIYNDVLQLIVEHHWCKVKVFIVMPLLNSKYYKLPCSNFPSQPETFLAVPIKEELE